MRKVYESLDEDSMLMVAFTGRTEQHTINLAAANQEEPSLRNNLYKGRCFVKVKTESVDKLEAEIKELYDKVNPGKEMKDENEELQK